MEGITKGELFLAAVMITTSGNSEEPNKFAYVLDEAVRIVPLIEKFLQTEDEHQKRLEEEKGMFGREET